MGAWGLCPLASTAQSPGTPRNLRNAPALLKLVCCAQKTRAWARENFGCEHRVKGTDFCHGFMAASPFLFPVSPLWAITLYLIFYEKSFNFSLCSSSLPTWTHPAYTCVHITFQLTNLQGLSDRVNSNFSVWWWKAPAMQPVLWVALPISPI